MRFPHDVEVVVVALDVLQTLSIFLFVLNTWINCTMMFLVGSGHGQALTGQHSEAHCGG